MPTIMSQPTSLDDAMPAPSWSTGPSAAPRPTAARTARPGKLEVRMTERRSFCEYHLTGTVDRWAPRGAAADLFLQAAEVLAEGGIQPMQEKLYGLVGARGDALRWREEAWRRHELDFHVPVTWVQGTPLDSGDFVGFQIWGIAPRDNSTRVTTVENAVTGRGRLWTGPGFRLLHLPAVRGLEPDGRLADGAPAQADRMFANAARALQEHGMELRHVVRTWIYLARLLEWYGDFNRVRNAHYKPAGLGAAGGPAFPASTGIQGRMDGEECVMDVLAFECDGPACPTAVPIRRSPRQDQSFNYGSAFSRGMALEMEGHRTVHISGTASINAAGASTHLGDAEMQSVETLLNIAAILQDQGGSLKNIKSATLFCKDRAAWEAWNRVSHLLQVPAFPKICVQADVCRHDLLVEMEAVAVI